MSENNIEENLKTLWGYSIRNGTPTKDKKGKSKLINGWVPTSHDFTVGLGYYLEYRQNKAAQNMKENYREWLENKKYGKHFWYVANPNEFNFEQEDTNFIKKLLEYPKSSDKKTALDFLNLYRVNAINNKDSPWGDFPKYIMDTYLSGQLAKYTDQKSKEKLKKLKYAGTDNAAGAILTVGRSFGRHFGFLNDDKSPTKLFNKFFISIDKDIEN